jgi:hypothetical protein
VDTEFVRDKANSYSLLPFNREVEIRDLRHTRATF